MRLGSSADCDRGRWVKTDNGQAYADAVNVPEPPTDVEASVNKIFQLVCSISSLPCVLLTVVRCLRRREKACLESLSMS